MKEVCLRTSIASVAGVLFRLVDSNGVTPLVCPYSPSNSDMPCGEVCALFDIEMEQGQGGQPSKMFVTCRGTRFGRLRLATGHETVLP